MARGGLKNVVRNQTKLKCYKKLLQGILPHAKTAQIFSRKPGREMHTEMAMPRHEVYFHANFLESSIFCNNMPELELCRNHQRGRDCGTLGQGAPH